MNFPSIYGIMVINGHYCLLMVMNDMIFNGYSWLLKVMNGYIYIYIYGCIYMDVNMVNILHMLHPIIDHPADQPFGCCAKQAQLAVNWGYRFPHAPCMEYLLS